MPEAGHAVRTNYDVRLASLLRQFPSPRRALELGCGDSPALEMVLPESSPVLYLMIGVDRDLAPLRRARRQDSARYLVQADLHLVQADAARLPFRCRFDLILVRHPDIDQNHLTWKPTIQKAIDWLAESGLFLITTYSVSEIESAGRWLAEAGRTPIGCDERRLIPAGLDGRDRYMLVYRS